MTLLLNETSDHLYDQALAQETAVVSDAAANVYLAPALAYTHKIAGGRQLQVLDSSLHTNPATEAVCTATGSEYNVVAGGDGFDVTYDFAVSAVDAVAQGATPDRIVEQLQATRSGGLALFGYVDWGSASAEQGSAASTAFQKAVDYIVMVGMQDNDLGEAVQAIAALQPGLHDVREARSDLPEGDYRALFLAAAWHAYARLMQERDSKLLEAGNLLRSIEAIERANDLVIYPPQLVTATVLVNRSLSAS